MYYKCCKIDSHSSATNFGFDKKLKIDFPVCTIYSIRIAICISRTVIYRDAVLVGDTQPYSSVYPRSMTNQYFMWAETREPREKPPGTPASRTWLVSHMLVDNFLS